MPEADPLSAAQTDQGPDQRPPLASPVYCVARYTVIEGAIDIAQFETALRQVVDEVDSLRLQFIESEHGLSQFIGSPLWSLSRIDVSGQADPYAAAHAWMRADYEQPGNVLQEPLFRYALLHTAPDRVLWYQRYHARVIDELGAHLIAQRVAHGYRTLCAGMSPPSEQWAPAWTRDAQHPASAQESRDDAYRFKRDVHWPEPATLASRCAPALQPALRHTMALPSHAFGDPAGDTAQLTSLMTAAMAAYLSRLSSIHDVALGCSAWGATEPYPLGSDATMPLRLMVQSDMSLASLTQQAEHEIQRGRQSLRDSSDTLLRSLGRASGQSLFRTAVHVMPLDDALTFGELTSTTHPLRNGPVDDLRVTVYPRADDGPLRIDFDANPACYTADELAGHQHRFVRFLQTLAAAPTQPMGDIDLLEASERQRLLLDWNATQQAYPDNLGVHQLFEAQVERTPQAVAVVLGAQSITYAQLERRANQLAWHLRTLGVGPDAVVGLCVERSIEMVVGVLGILKAGGAYLPLDPSYPRERLASLMQQARVPVLVTQSRLQPALPRPAAQCVRLDTDWAQIAAEPDTRPASGVLPDHLAYVTYTSGSTGEPKGVMTRHRGAANYLNFLVRHYCVTEKDVVLNVASLAFDASVRDLIGPLIAGARVVLISTAHAKEPHRYVGALHEQRVTALLSITPSLLRSVCQAAERRGVGGALRMILVSGEALDAPLVARVHQTLGAQVQVFNQYGPTECTMTSTWFAAVPDTQGTVPIGQPLSNVRVYVLDRQLKPLPPDVTGELYIAGAGLARGYFNQPALSAERFIANPFGHGERLYRTGDLARWRANGQLDYVGRIDNQIKLRGQRIEPGEIEACLNSYAQVRDAVVLARGDGEHTRLVAYVIAESDASLASTLYEHVAARLPDYMVPAAFVRLDAFPLTPNGKLDRRALPEPDDEAWVRQAYEAPQGELETELATIWAELLGVERVGRHDSFFALGGHSLLAVRLLNRIVELGAEVPLATLFASPTLAAFAAAVNAQLHRGTDTLSTIPPVSREGHLPLSFAQQRLWFLAQLDGVSRTYHMSRAWRVHGPLNRSAWQQALDALFARHEALRSVFVSVEGQLQVQLLPAATGVPMSWHDLRDVPDVQTQLVQLSAEAAQAPFDLAHGPLMRACGIQLADDEHVLVLTQHHIVSDGWSIGVLVRELNALYTAACRSQPDPLPALSIQYPDYAAWQRQWLSGKRLQAQSDYWRTRLADAPVLLALPTDRPRPAQPSLAGAQVPVCIDASTTQALKRLSREHGTTLFMTVLAAWSAVLARLSGQDDLVIGTPSANRGHPAIEPLIGFFVNTLVLRVDLSGAPTTAQLLERVRRTTLEAQAHQDLPFEQVVEIVQPPRRLNHTPLFQVMLAWQGTQTENWCLPNLTVTPTGLEANTVKFDLELELQESGDETVGALCYASTLFDQATIQRHVGYFQTMLQAMAADAAHPVTRVELLAPAERTLLLETWNATAQDYPAHQCIHQLFEAQVERTPEATALMFEEQALSYAELNVRANRLAHQLIELGVKPDARVAICVERSPAMVVGLLAILKAGGAYVPLDPAYPGERLAHILADAAPSIVLADAVGRSSLGEASLAARTVLDPNTLPERAQTNPSVQALTSRHLAYVIYTSGSTGTPKGVMVLHRGVVNLAQAQIACFGVDASSRILQFASFSFDASSSEMVMAFGSGATLYLPPKTVRHDRRRLCDYLAKHTITHATLPPALLQHGEDLSSLSLPLTVILAGEASSSTLIQALAKQGTVFNAYGPTEATVCATIWRGPRHFGGKAVPIGRPIANTRIYLLDIYCQPVPLGAVGELYIGGAGVARGYLNRPELTAERFVRDPFSSQPDARMYKTGDLARYLPDGNLEFLGRNDHQVKIRGFRIEPGEIEACLNSHPQANDALVLARGDGDDKRLVAYVRAEPDDALANTLRTHVAARLPDYMVPAAFVRLDAFPLTPNGKLDRRALPAPAIDALVHQAYEVPQGELESALATIWAELLGVERVGRHDSFFALGGHSLLAVRLLNRIVELGAEVPLATLFASPTLAAFAAAIDARRHHGTDMLPEITPVSREGPLPPSFAQQRLWFLAQLDGVSRTYHMPLAWRVHGPLNRSAWQQALDALFARHETLRSVFVSVEGQPQVQLLPAKTGVPMTWHDLRGMPDADAQLARLSDEAVHAPFDLAHGPLLRARGIRLADDEHVLILTQHHIVSDGWSIGVLVRELNALYRAACGEPANPLPALNVQYPDYAAWQRQWLSGERLQAQSDYWCTRLADAPVLLALPTDRPRPVQPSFAGAQVPVRIDASTTQALKRLSQEQGTTLFMTVLAAWSVVLARLSGQDDLVIGTPSANRGHPAIEPLIGFFVNTLALRVDLSGAPTTTQLLERVRCTTLEAQTHQDLPFEQVVEIVQPPRRLNHTPLFQVMFAWQGTQTENWCLPNLTVTPTELEGNTVKFDLELALQESGDTIVGALCYASALFDQTTIERHVGYLQTVLRAMVAHPEQPVTTLELLSPAERQLLLKTWNATECDYPSQLCIHQLFEAQVERTPEATALMFEEQALSYAELNVQANRLAHQLIELGVKPDARVAICVERSPAMVVGLLAILKAGGAYVPLDPMYPGERLAHILADAAPAIVLADAAGRGALGDTALAERIVLDLDALPGEVDTNPSVPGLTARHLAYVIYTSGSTGKPKGVMVEHQSLVNLYSALQSAVLTHCPIHARVGLNASVAFDASLKSVLSLLSGCTLVLIPQAVRSDGAALLQCLATTSIDVLDCTPVQLEMLLSADLLQHQRPLTVLVGGEPIAPLTWQTLVNASHLTVCNVYGPTECTVDATLAVLSSDQMQPTIGRPIANTRIYLLDIYCQPVPLGAVGELYIGGAGVARGYLNRPGLTVERFVRDPFVLEPDARMYKTGDLARYLPDGNLEFLGRNDHQVKIRGFRIEPGEIEACLSLHPQVHDALVLACGDGDDKRLVAYVRAEPDDALANTLRAHVAACLPDYMVPAAFVRLDAWPLTPNGKLDRRALPAPSADAFAHQVYEAPRGELETTLAEIWAELLGVERVGRHDSFFTLGGHSLLAVQLIERLRRLGLGLSVRALFDTPTLSVLAQALSQPRDVTVPPNVITPETTILTPSMLPLIELTQADIDRIVRQVPGGIANLQDIYALSPLQDGILFHHLLATKGDPYLLITQLVFDTRELLDQYLAAVQQVANRHDILRTAFVWEGLSTPAQVVWRHAPLSITELTLDRADGPIAEQLAQRFDPRHTRLELTQAPLLRCAIAQDTDGCWQVVQLQHHLIGDHLTLEVMHTEVRAFIEGQGETLPAAQPFRNLVAQARLGVSQVEHARFFTEQLADIEEPTLPFGLAEVYRDGAHVHEAHRTLPPALNDRLRAQARRLDVSLASLCHLAWAQVLARASGQPRVVFGTVLFGRMQAGSGADSAMGLFINTLPLRVDLAGSVEAAVRATHARLAALLEYEHASLALAQRCSSVPAGTPLFSALLNYRHNAISAEKSGMLPGVELFHSKERDNYPIGLSIEDSGQALGLTAQIIEPLDADRVCGYMQQALEGLADVLETTPEWPVGQLEVLPKEERSLLIETWNATEQAYPSHLCIHQLFEAQVARTPEAIALVYEEQTLRYVQLNAQTNRLAHELIKLGVKPDTRVAVYAQRSPEMIVGILATLKAGGAYVPLDPAYPPERLAYMVTDSAPAVLLSVGTPPAAVTQCLGAGVPVLDLQADIAQWARQSARNPELALTAQSLAYVIYTSGSTGQPKGVMIPHRSAVNLVTAMAQKLGVTAHDRVLQCSSLSFDASVGEIFVTLTQGAALVLRTDAWLAGAQQFWALCKANRVSVTDLPTQFWSQLAQEKVPVSDSVRVVMISGEALSVSAQSAWFAGAGHRPRLFNVYGPTEATVTATVHEVIDKENNWRTIGRPIDNTRLYILNAYKQPVPLGAVGELYIGGAGVARGYLNRPELTVERFVSDPFTAEPDARMYKTGDLARYLPDGNLEFLGRNDHQVKIRGFRIELGEIEACLTQHAQVCEAAVLAMGEGSAKRLVAYVVAEPDDALAGTLRTHVAAALPEYMVPSAFVRLDALPLTSNGKLDRRALPAPSADAFAHQVYEAPRGELETTLAEIWSELLGVERVGRHDSFFALGGHSLLAVRLINWVSARVAEVPLATLFTSPTLAGFAAALSAQWHQGTNTLPEITPVSRESALPLSFAQQRLWFLAQLDGVSDTYHMPMALRLRGTLNPVAWQQALDALWARHEALRSVFVSIDGQPQVQLLPAETGVPITWHDLRGERDAQSQLVQLSAKAAQALFDLTRGPLIRACGIQLADDEHVMLLVQHHIVSDGWSIGVMARELSALYTAACAGHADPLPPLVIQYPDYAVWQRQWLSGERLQAQNEYWRATLADAPVLLALPTDRPRPAQQSFAGAYVPIRIDAPTTRALKRLSQAHGATLFMTVLAAWSAVLARLSGQGDLVIGTPSANRHHRQIEPLIGFFVNTLALRVDVSGEPSAAQLLERVRRTTLEAQAHQDLPFEQVVEIVQPPRRLEHTPLFQVMFAWQSNETGAWQLPGLEITPADLAYEVVKFDLALHLYELGEEIVGGLGYATALFDCATIERHVGYLQTMLQAMAADDQHPVTRVELLTPAERTLLLETWNATQQDYPSHQCIHQLFEEQVERTPEATALFYEDQLLSYAQLNVQANRLAYELIEIGVKPDARVAVCVERSPVMVVGLLAILKAGGAYVPLDPAYPGERLVHILEDAAPQIVLADAAGRAALGDAALANRTVLDPNTLPARAQTNPSVPTLMSHHLAYVIYTSGSTGMPKGVMVEHVQAVNLLCWALQAFGPSETQRTLFATSISFDLSVYECFVPLAQGSTVHLVNDALALIHHAHPVSLINTVPSAMHSLLTHQANLSSAATINVAGEPLKASLIKQIFEQTPVQRLCNLYGPSESTTYSTWLSIQRGDPAIESVGRPIANTQIYLLDSYGQPVPLGAVGELYIGGAGVARGYLNRPELTAERFVRDPFSGEPNARMYKTGDLARYLPDGNLAFLGRNDHQVKIRGFRIEPGEIEARLAQHPQVHDAVVLARGEGQAKRLVAYVVAEPDNMLASTLRMYVAAALPEYMVPSAFVRLDALPLTSNGKLDRRALPAPHDDALVRQVYEAPQGEFETALAAIWAELLGVERVGRHDSFFALGGHSLLAMRLMSRVRDVLGVELAIRTLFEAPMLASLAQRLVEQQGSQESSFDVLLALKPQGSRPPLFCIHPAMGLSWSYMGLLPHLDSDQPLYGLQACGFGGTRPLAPTIEAMVLDYLEQIRRIQPQGPYYLLGWSLGGNVAHSIAAQLEQHDESVALLALLDSHPSPGVLDDASELDEAIHYAALVAQYGEALISAMDEPLRRNAWEIAKNHHRILKEFSPPIYGGNALFFHATLADDQSPTLVPRDVWQPYVRGNIEIYDIHCVHSELLEPESAAAIGRVINRKLNELSDQRGKSAYPAAQTRCLTQVSIPEK
ncbi:non-ribosomal peptide synthase/polyketide synthase [Mycetohabitans sp. B2]|nr:non-ribosomal peptide synthase/polyketide synthase [Mycetohabitans sp. B2]